MNSEGEQWTRYRQALATKMLRPKELEEYIDGFNDVVGDVIKRIEILRENQEKEVQDLEGELAKWAAESKLIKLTVKQNSDDRMTG